MPRDIHFIPNFLGSILIDGETLEDLIGAGGATDVELVRDTIGTALVEGQNIDIVVSDAGDTITISVENLTSADISDFAAAAVSAANAGTIDADTLGGDSKSTIIAAAVASVVGGASAAYDTLVEIQALMAADDTAATAMSAAITARARYYAAAITSGSPTATVTHNLGLANMGDFTARIFVSATGVEEEYDVTPTNGNSVVVTDETGANIAAGRRIFIVAGAS